MLCFPLPPGGRVFGVGGMHDALDDRQDITPTTAHRFFGQDGDKNKKKVLLDGATGCG